MPKRDKRLARELLTITKMTEMYCCAHHGTSPGSLCRTCDEFVDYVGARLDKCPYADCKPTCANCPIHCYKRTRQQQGREIMRFSGPKMLARHPLLTIAHMLDGFIKVKHPRELTREQRLHSRGK